MIDVKVVIPSGDEYNSLVATEADNSGTEAPTGYHRKRARTRRLLITAGMEVLARRGPDGATVGEIAGEAGVSPGTFYNHFPSLIDLVEAITGELQTGVEIASTTLDSIDNDPAIRVAIGTEQLLAMTTNDAASAAAFVSLLAAIPSFRLRIRSVIEQAVQRGVDTESFDVTDVGAATDAVLGSVVQWIRSDLARESTGVPVTDRATLILRLLGVSKRDAQRIVKRAFTATDSDADAPSRT